MPSLRQEIQQTRSFESAEQETYLNLQRTAGALAGQFDRLLKYHQLTQPQYNVLRILRGQQGKGLPSSQIGERMVTREPDVTRLVDKLIRLSLVDRARSEEDRRVVLVSITAAGMKMLAHLDAPVLDMHRLGLGHLTAGELNDLNRLLVKARQSAS